MDGLKTTTLGVLAIITLPFAYVYLYVAVSNLFPQWSNNYEVFTENPYKWIAIFALMSTLAVTCKVVIDYGSREYKPKYHPDLTPEQRRKEILNELTRPKIG